MKYSVLTLMVVTGCVAISVAAWNQAGYEALALAWIMGCIAFMMSLVASPVLYLFRPELHVFLNATFWAVFLVVLSTLFCFAMAEPPELLVVWTFYPGVAFSAVMCVAGWFVGLWLKRPFNPSIDRFVKPNPTE